MHYKLKLGGVSCCFSKEFPNTARHFTTREEKSPISKNKSVFGFTFGRSASLILLRLSKKRRSLSCVVATSSQRVPALSCELESEENHFQKRKTDCAACRVITGCVIEGSIVFYLKRPILKYLVPLYIPDFTPLSAFVILIVIVCIYYYTVPSAYTVPCRPHSYFRLQATL